VEEATIPVDLIEEFITRLLGLPDVLRDVVCLRFIGLTYSEIARKQGIVLVLQQVSVRVP
jgi:DNA-directed RNA polymerase specialized sigma24 family protein